MTTEFSAEFFAGNRQRLRRAVQAEHPDVPIVVAAHGLLQRSGDTTWPFHQDSNFWYLTGISEPDITLVIDGTHEYLLVPGRSASREAFDGAVRPEQLTATSGVWEVLDEADGLDRLQKQLARSRSVATPLAPPQYIEQYGLYTNPARARLMHGLQEAVSGLQTVDIRSQLAGLRVIKQAPELAAIREAIAVTVSGLEAVTDPGQFVQYRHEYEIEADLTRAFRLRGAAGHAFAPIVAGGARACTLHNTTNQAALPNDALVVLDVGAEVSHYAADITRTRVYGTASARQQAVFDAVVAVQQYALGLLTPGTLLKDYEQQVADYLGGMLVQLKLVTSADRAAIRRYYPHAASHFLGLDVHDVGDYTRPLEPGMVLTCEPGIYIPEEGIGVRIEDDILITDKGAEVLSQALPKTLM